MLKILGIHSFDTFRQGENYLGLGFDRRSGQLSPEMCQNDVGVGFEQLAAISNSPTLSQFAIYYIFWGKFKCKPMEKCLPSLEKFNFNPIF